MRRLWVNMSEFIRSLIPLFSFDRMNEMKWMREWEWKSDLFELIYYYY